MAITVVNSTTYSGSYLNSHPVASGYSCTGTDSYLLQALYNRVAGTEITGTTANGNAMTAIAGTVSENTNVCGTRAYGYVISNASFNIVTAMSNFRLLGGIPISLNGVDQTTPTTGTPVTTGNYGSSATASYTGTAGNMLIVLINLQGARTLTASNCTAIQSFDHTDANLGQCFAGYVTATGSAQTIGATWTSDDNWRLTILEIKAASASTSVKDIISAGFIPFSR